MSAGLSPNELWCTDYKGEFMLADRRYCYPLTVTDHASRYLLLCEAMESNAERFAFTAIERIRPGHPQQNGRHERMHLTLKKEATRPPGANILQQQAKFDEFIDEFNSQRPHEALQMRCPAEVYRPSPRPYVGIPEPHYPFHDRTVMVTSCGRLCLYRKKINLSITLAGQAVGVKEVDEGIWLVSFMQYDLGYVDLEEKTLQPLKNPFGLRDAPTGPTMKLSSETEASPAGEQLAKG